MVSLFLTFGYICTVITVQPNEGKGKLSMLRILSVFIYLVLYLEPKDPPFVRRITVLLCPSIGKKMFPLKYGIPPNTTHADFRDAEM